MSVSSLEGSPLPLDLAAKYQKVTAEYAKIRARFIVLKEAVRDEQDHSKELEETLRIKDQNLRKAEQEIDSLNFRNQQLSKRVSFLLDELDAVQNSVKKGKSKGPSKDIPNSILAEELQKKILENAQLVSTLQEQSEKYETENFELVRNKEMYKHELEECKKMLLNVEETKLTKIENENKQLLAKLNQKEEALQKLSNEIRMLRSKANEKGVELENNNWLERFVDMLQSLQIEELLRLVITFFLNFEIRYQKFVDVSVIDKFSKCIASNVGTLGAFINSYSSYCINLTNSEDILSGFESLSGDINNYLILLDELNIYIKSGKSDEISQIFKDVIASVKNHWVQFQCALKSCANSTRSSDGDEYATAIADVFRSLRSTCDYFSSSLTDKTKGPESEKESDHEIITVLTRIGAESRKIYKILTENKSVIRNAVEYKPIKQRANLLEVDEGECCKHWKEKYESVNAALSKKIRDLEEQVSCLSGAATPRSSHSGNTVQSPVEGKDKVTDITNIFGSLTGPGQWENQEAELTKYFNARANTLISDRQLAESKVTALKSECEALQKRLEHSMECRQMLETSIKQSQDTVVRLQEELNTTTSNYELQLSSLSEHMANMNGKLAAQQEEIEILNYKLTEKGAKKGKSK
ncbi:UNVERIFIED_CONTAM: hypothetical protein PYX00_006943 [Menopon gallinae]|uniref:Protein phosphatase 1 regulatory subunit 21 N-terminal domain-containing protein n=1 Tax=Menopon gallinae TaxID=328185 RepID=A0AAW2HGX7_9NEOP